MKNLEVYLNNVKVSKELSQETLAFSAEIWGSGRFIGKVKNWGTGGCHMYDFDTEMLNDWVESQRIHPERKFEKLDFIIDRMVAMYLGFDDEEDY